MDDRAQDVEELVEQHYSRLVATVQLTCGSVRQAEDAVQDALLKYWTCRLGVVNPFAWVAAVAINRTRDTARRGRTEAKALARLRARDGAPTCADTPLPSAPFGVLDEQVRGLPELQRRVVVLFYLLDMSTADIATLLGVSQGSVKTSLHRARESLRKGLGEVSHANDR